MAEEERHDAERITAELSEDGETGRLFIMTNRDRRLVVAANRNVLSDLNRHLSRLLGR